MSKEKEQIVDIEVETSGIGRVSGDEIDSTIDNYQEARGVDSPEELAEDPYEEQTKTTE